MYFLPNFNLARKKEKTVVQRAKLDDFLAHHKTQLSVPQSSPFPSVLKQCVQCVRVAEA